MSDSVNRRKFLKLMGKGVATGLAAVGGAVASKSLFGWRQRLLREKQRTSSGLLRDPDLLERNSGDFGGICWQRPSAVLFPQNPADIQEIIHYCRKQNLTLNTRGAGHSCNGQSLAGNGVSVDLKSFFNQVELEGETAVIGGGATWREVLDRLEPRGRTVPINPDFLALTVAGNISAGGCGHRAIREGFTADQVERLEVVTGDGKLIRCSLTENPEIFSHLPFGFGQLGIITRVWMRTVPRRRAVRMVILPFTSFREFISAAIRLAQTPPGELYDLTYGQWSAQFFCGEIVLGKDETKTEMAPFEDFARSLSPRMGRMRRDDYDRQVDEMVWNQKRRVWNFYHPWVDFFPPLEEFPRLTENGLARVIKNNPGLKNYLNLYFVWMNYERMGRNYSFCTVPRGRGENGIFTGYYFDLPRDERIETVKDLLAGLIVDYLEKGSGMYLYGWYRLTGEQRQRLWSGVLEDYFALKLRTDPDRIINPNGIINSLMT